MDNTGKLGLGTVQFGIPYGISNREGQTPPAQVKKILETAIRNNIEVLDSASAYGNAEEVLGKCSLDSFKIISKFLPTKVGIGVLQQFEKSLKDLKITQLYGYLAHRPSEILTAPEEWEILLKLKERGKVKKIGFSLNEPRELEILLDRDLLPDLVQVPFNYFDRRFQNAAEELKKTGCEVHTRSTFLQGLFFMDPQELPAYFDEVKLLLSNLQKNRLLAGNLLKFVLDQPFIDKVIIGVENEAQLISNLKSLKGAENLEKLTHTISNDILIPSRWPKN